jgi:hypothetical protein
MMSSHALIRAEARHALELLMVRLGGSVGDVENPSAPEPFPQLMEVLDEMRAHARELADLRDRHVTQAFVGLVQGDPVVALLNLATAKEAHEQTAELWSSFFDRLSTTATRLASAD